MATRLYLTAAAAHLQPAYYGSWQIPTAAPTANKLARSGNWPGATAFATLTSAAETVATNNRDVCIRRYLSDVLVAQDVPQGVAITGQMRLAESAAGMNALPQLRLNLVLGDGSDMIVVALSQNNATTNVDELTTTLRNQRNPSPSHQNPTLTNLAIPDGARLLLDVGVRAQNTVTTSYTATLRHGSTATPGGANDLSVGGAETTDLNPWIEIDHDLVFVRRTVGVAEALAMADSSGAVVRAQHQRALTEALAVTDAEAHRLARSLAPADVVGLTDARAFALYRRAVLGEALGISDATARALALRIALADELGVADDALASRTVRVSVADGISLDDDAQALAARAHQRSLADALNMGDAVAVAAMRVHAQAVEDSIVLTDGAGERRSLGRLLEEGVALTDAVVGRAQLHASLADALAHVDAAQVRGEGRLSLADDLALGDEASAAQARARSLEISEALVLADGAMALVVEGTGSEAVPVLVVVMEPVAGAAVALVPVADARVALVPIALADVDLEPVASATAKLEVE